MACRLSKVWNMKKSQVEQKALVNSFVRVTSADAKTALSILKAQNWNLERSINSYYGGGECAKR